MASPFDAMTDEEIVELGISTLHGDLPRETVMRLYFGACRLIDEKRHKEKEDDPELAEAKRTIKQAAKVIAHVPPGPDSDKLIAMGKTIEFLRQKANEWRDLYEKAAEQIEKDDAKCVSYKREVDLLQAKCEELEKRLAAQQQGAG